MILNINKIIGCIDIVSKIALYDALSTVNIQCDGDNSCMNGKFIIDTPILVDNAKNIKLSNTNISRVHFECNGQHACDFTIISIIGVNEFELNCNGYHACHETALTVTSLNENYTNPSGKISLNCYGTNSCAYSAINGITVAYVDINCEMTSACQYIQVIIYSYIYV